MIKELIEKERSRIDQSINLIASENICSEAVKAALASEFTYKYAEGYARQRYYGGNEVVDELEEYVIKLAQKVFRTDYLVNVQPYSGSIANLAVYWGLLKIGDTIMGLELGHGGHLTHGHPVTISGKLYNRVSYGVDQKTELLDYDEIEELANKCKPKLIISGASAYPREIDFIRISEIAHKVGAFHMADISHISGFVAHSLHPSPFDNADIITTTTHKLLRGPRGAIIFSRQDLSPKIDRAVFPGIQGGPHINNIAAIGVCLEEALSKKYLAYVQAVKENAKTLAGELIKNGFKLISGGTDNHLMLIDLRPLGLTGQQAQDLLEEQSIIVNKNAIPFDQAPPYNPSGIRLGTPYLTSQGVSAKDLKNIAVQIALILKK